MAAPKGGYFGKILEIDLTKQKYKERKLTDEECRKYIGGAGMGAYLLYNDLKAKHDPMAEDSPIFIGPGPLNGTFCVSTRISIVNKRLLKKRFLCFFMIIPSIPLQT